MTEYKEHHEPGHLNIHTRDHDSIVTNYGRPDRVVAFLPDASGLYIRVDHKWSLGEPTVAQILDVARKNQGIKGRWCVRAIERWDDGRSTDYYFDREA